MQFSSLSCRNYFLEFICLNIITGKYKHTLILHPALYCNSLETEAQLFSASKSSIDITCRRCSRCFYDNELASRKFSLAVVRIMCITQSENLFYPITSHSRNIRPLHRCHEKNTIIFQHQILFRFNFSFGEFNLIN